MVHWGTFFQNRHIGRTLFRRVADYAHHHFQKLWFALWKILNFWSLSLIKKETLAARISGSRFKRLRIRVPLCLAQVSPNYWQSLKNDTSRTRPNLKLILKSNFLYVFCFAFMEMKWNGTVRGGNFYCWNRKMGSFLFPMKEPVKKCI